MVKLISFIAFTGRSSQQRLKQQPLKISTRLNREQGRSLQHDCESTFSFPRKDTVMGPLSYQTVGHLSG